MAQTAGRGGTQATPPVTFGNAGRGGAAGTDIDGPVLATNCNEESRIACPMDNSIERVECKGGQWQPFQSCEENERCMARGGANTGECKAIIPVCAGREPGVPFCDGQVLRICNDLLSSTALACGANESCRATAAGNARCRCISGATEGDNGCQLATTCSGACDALTTCSMASGKPSCSACPPSYGGDGSRGCAPLLSDLTVTCGKLSPILSPEIVDYQVAVPLLCQQVTLHPTSPANTQIDINGRALQPNADWQSDPLSIGENAISITVAAPSGVTTKYKLTVVRAGVQEGFVKASNPGSADRLGASIAVDGDTMVAGAPYQGSAAGGVNSTPSGYAANSGAAYVYVREAGQWRQQAYLKAEVPTPDEFFGSSVAILGDTIAVGATGNDPTSQPAGTRLAGAVYLFTRTAGGSWVQTGKLTAADGGAGDMFGFQVVITGDQLAVTAPFESSGVSRSGALYLYARVGGGWQAQTKLKPSKASSYSGWGVGLAADRDTIAVGAFSDSSLVEHAGSATVFARKDGTWREQAHLVASTPRSGATFGLSAGVLGDTLIIGAPRWGHYIQTPSGEVYVFKRILDQWQQTMVLTAPVPRNSDFFGSSIVLTPTMLVIGANGDSSGARGLQGNPADASVAASGAIYLYARSGDNFARTTYIKAARPSAGDAFGVASAVSGDTLVTGAAYDDVSDSGALYVFR